MTVAEMVTNAIIEKLECGFIPWVKPWQGGEAVNYITQKPYHGINRLLLDGGEYITFNQVQELHAHIRKGSKSHLVIFYKPFEVVNNEEEEPELKFVLRYYRVFNINDVDGIESKRVHIDNDNKRLAKPQEVIDNYINREGIRHQDDVVSNNAYYSPSNDMIVLPTIKQHTNSNEFYSTAFHELTHSTGHSKRLNRDLEMKASFGSKNYSREELIAEIGSAILMNMTGVETQQTLTNSAGYCQGWAKFLKGDANAILVAAAKAEKAVEFILNK